MKVGILGSGFGLYGYLPAVLLGCGEQAMLPARYRKKLLSRRDEAFLADRVDWQADERAVLDRADAVIISKRPADQVVWAGECAARANIAKLLLEKPLAPDPATASALTGRLAAAGKPYRIDYTFRELPWGRALIEQARRGARTGSTIHIDWAFRAHHYATDARNWKRQISTGGGALRFFGIHLVALLAELGYDRVVESTILAAALDEAETWRATIAGTGLPPVHLDVASNSPVTVFAVGVRRPGAPEAFIARLADPFDEADRSGALDRRVDILARLCKEFLYGDGGQPGWYGDVIALWSEIEARTTHVVRAAEEGEAGGLSRGGA